MEKKCISGLKKFKGGRLYPDLNVSRTFFLFLRFKIVSAGKCEWGGLAQIQTFKKSFLVLFYFSNIIRRLLIVQLLKKHEGL